MKASHLIFFIAFLALALAGGYLVGQEWGRAEAAGVERVAVTRFAEPAPIESALGSLGFSDESRGLLDESARQQLEIGSMERDDIERRLGEVRGRSSVREYNEELALLWRRLAELDVAGAAAKALALPPVYERTIALTAVLATWAADDPEAAWTWVHDNIADPIYRSGRYHAIFSQMVEQGQIDLALSKVAEMDDRTKATALGSFSNLLAQYEPDRLVDLMELLPDGPARQNAMRSFISTWAGQDPAAAVEWVYGLDDPSVRQANLVSVLLRWAGSPAGEEALQWVRSLPPSADAETGKRVVAANLVGSHPEDAFSLAMEIQDSEVRRQTFDQMLFRLTYHPGPEQARGWLERLPPGSVSTRAIEAIVTTWRQRDAAAAESFVRGTPLLSDEERERLLGQLAGQAPAR